MKYIIWIVILGLSYFIGTVGFCQIIGSLQHRQKGFLYTILVWVVILAGVYLLARYFVRNELSALYIGYAVSLVRSISVGKIE